MLPEDEAAKHWKKQHCAFALQLSKMLYNYNKPEMKQINSFLFALLGILLLVACDNLGLNKTKSGQALPPFIHKKDKIILTLRVQDVFDNEELVKKDRDSLLVGFHAKQSQQVENYLKEHNIQATKTAKGTFVEIKTPGEGPAID